jgi:hypothetical protein
MVMSDTYRTTDPAEIARRNKLAEEIVEGAKAGGELSDESQALLALSEEVLRLRAYAEEAYELLTTMNGRDVYDKLKPRIDKLYINLNARARGDETDIEGDPIQPWNHLVGALTTALAHWMANARWAVEEHRNVEALRDALVNGIEIN